jgi:hypothetical protein
MLQQEKEMLAFIIVQRLFAPFSSEQQALEHILREAAFYEQRSLSTAGLQSLSLPEDGSNAPNRKLFTTKDTAYSIYFTGKSIDRENQTFFECLLREISQRSEVVLFVRLLCDDIDWTFLASDPSCHE